jgi:hypothetical protein
MPFKKLIPVAILGLCGCTQAIVSTISGVTPEQIAAAPRRPLAQAEKKIVEDAIASNLKDPFSAQYQHSDLIILKNKNGGSVYCPFVNSKNSYGGYVGYMGAYMVVFTDPKDAVIEARLIQIGSPSDSSVSEMCAERGYAR